MHTLPLLKAAGMATIACSAALLLSACDSSSSGATSQAEPTEVTASETPADDDRENGDLPTIEAGTYTYTKGPFPVTYTTTETTFDPSYGNDPHRVLLGDPYGSLIFDFPVKVADLTQLVTEEESGDGERFLFAGPIDFPADIGAWLAGAVALEIVDQGTLSLADGDVSWWDVEVSDPSARCFSDSPPDEDPCVVLWPYLDEQDDRQVGEFALGSRRVYAIEVGSEPLMASAGTDGTPEEDVAGWLANTDEIVSSITLG